MRVPAHGSQLDGSMTVRWLHRGREPGSGRPSEKRTRPRQEGTNEVAENLVLPVQETLSAVYLVPATLPDQAVKRKIKSALSAHVPDPVGLVARKMLDVGAVRVAVQPSSGLPPVPVALQKHLGVPQELLRAVTGASRFVVSSASWPPGWPPMHESVARACAAALAAEMNVPIVDTFIPKVLAAEPAIAALPGADYKVRLADWVLVFQSADSTGLWMTTKGLGRFGLPELQVHGVPPQLGGPWTYVMSGLASRLLDLWLDALRQRDGAAFAEVPAEVEVSEADVASAYATTGHGDGHARVRLTFDPAAGDHEDSFLTVQPPDEYRGSAGEYMSDVCAALFGSSEPDVRYLARTEAMDQAIRAATEGLPAARERFLMGDLPPQARLMVKYEIPADDGSEYPWAYVTSWKSPEKVLGSSAGDALRDPVVRAGRPVVIDTATIVDWAVWIDGQGIIEGGGTNSMAIRDGAEKCPDGE